MRVGCCGFPVARASYYRRFDAVELDSTFYDLPRLETARAWRAEAPEGFDFALKAPLLITHPSSNPSYERRRGRLSGRPGRYGHFQDSDEVRAAFAATGELVEALRARFLLFQTPPSFHPGAESLRALCRFFKGAPRGRATFVWEPHGGWEPSVVERVCADLDLLRVCDPLREEPPRRGAALYCRVHGVLDAATHARAHDLGDPDLARLRERCPARSWLFFGNRGSFRDAGRFKKLAGIL